MESQVRGGTRWKRFAVVMVPSVAATACIGVALAQGALAASFAVSGQSFKVTADQLDGTGFTQYGALDSGYNLDGSKTAHPVAVSAFKSASITNMCQSVVVPIPVLGNLSVVLRAGGGGTPVQATDLVIDADQVNADATFTGVTIGASAADIAGKTGIQGFDKHTGNPDGSTTPFAAGDFGQVVDHAVLTGVKQTAYSTTAGTMALKGLSISANLSSQGCY